MLGNLTNQNALHFSGLFSPSDLTKIQMKCRPFSTCSLPYLTGKASSSPFFFSSQSPATALAPLSSAVSVGIALGLFCPASPNLSECARTAAFTLTVLSRCHDFDCPMPHTTHDKTHLLLKGGTPLPDLNFVGAFHVDLWVCSHIQQLTQSLQGVPSTCAGWDFSVRVTNV